jgi:hypothetical protein
MQGIAAYAAAKDTAQATGNEGNPLHPIAAVAACCFLHCQGAGTQVSRELDTQVMITALALPHGGKILFAATESGVVRCYKYPLTGEHMSAPTPTLCLVSSGFTSASLPTSY